MITETEAFDFTNDKTSNIILSVLFILMTAAAMIIAKILFADEFSYFFDWWLTILALGIIFLPLSACIFKGFSDLGWLFSKTLGIAMSGWLMWYLSSLKMLKFTRLSTFIVLFICLLLNAGLLIRIRYINGPKSRSSLTLKRIFSYRLGISNLTHIMLAELVFTALFVLWTYIKGFQPQAYGTTEKLMDFGFMQAMWKSEYMPPEDLWLSGHSINYYYVGQFLATYLAKLSGVGVEYGYNFMLMMTASMGFVLPASVIMNAARDHGKADKRSSRAATAVFPYLAAMLSGLMVSFNSNLQYLLYAKIIPTIRTILGIDKLAEASGYTFSSYWFPNATRYIGYDPETHDKTIHEFPLYSFVLGDLHAHVINIIFVLTVTAVLYAYMQYRREALQAARLEGISLLSVDSKGKKKIPDFFTEVFHPCVLVLAFFIGLFHTTNYWDYPIYFVVAGAILLFTNAIVYGFSLQTLKLTLFHAITVLAGAALVCLPFTLSFNKISSSINLCVNHTPFYQLLILWGFPVICVAIFIANTAKDLRKDGVFDKSNPAIPEERNGLFRFMGGMEASDLFVITIGLCAAGLVLIPEIIYVKDIYSGDYKRANTMFKLTYQAFILFGTACGYILARNLLLKATNARRVGAVIGIILIILSTGYFDNSVKAWFGSHPLNEDGTYSSSEALFDWLDYSNYKGLNAGEYLQNVNEQDYEACNWINENIEGRPVMLEVNGASYTDYCRVSVRTGLPTVLGWYTHEWLWQSGSSLGLPEIISERSADIEAIYTSSDAEEVKELIDKYNIEYIYVGDLEKSKYENPVCHELLISLGQVVYPADFEVGDCETTTYIIKVNP